MHRYTDFLVNEILPSGEVVHLDNLKAHPKPHKTTELSTAARASSASTMLKKVDDSPVKPEQAIGEEERAATARVIPPHPHQHRFPPPDTPNLEHPASQSKNDLSVVEAQQALPDSMQDFNKFEPVSTPPEGTHEKISPHKRIPPPVAPIPLSMQDLDGKQSDTKQEKATRRKEKVHIRQTSQGWVEFDKEKENEIAKRKVEDDVAADVQSKGDTVMEEIQPESTTRVRGSSELDPEQTPETSTQASWQAFAGSAPSSSFRVSIRATQSGN